jgi:hypothetical protein
LTFVSVGNFFLCILLLLKNLCSSVKVKVISLFKVTKQNKKSELFDTKILILVKVYY